MEWYQWAAAGWLVWLIVQGIMQYRENKKFREQQDQELARIRQLINNMQRRQAHDQADQLNSLLRDASDMTIDPKAYLKRQKAKKDKEKGKGKELHIPGVG